jgi:hypothetical protein
MGISHAFHLVDVGSYLINDKTVILFNSHGYFTKPVQMKSKVVLHKSWFSL